MIGTAEVWLVTCDRASCKEHIRMDSKNEIEIAIKLMGWHTNGEKTYCEKHSKRRSTAKLEHSKDKLIHVHSKELCEGRACPIHHRTKHHMRSWPQHWRSDRQFMERICSHGIGHPDPDQRDYLIEKMGEANAGAEFVHGCDGCCSRKVAG